MTVEIRENVDLHREAEAELFCPFCGTHTINTVVNHGTLKMNCTSCGMNSFVTRMPRKKNLKEFISRRLIA